jgi:hypothetical protein
MWDQKQGNQMRISIIEHPTLNVERKSSLRCSMLGCSMLDAGCWMFVLILLIAGTANAAYDPTAHKTDFTTFETIWHDATRNRDVPAKIYYPTTAPSKLPVIIFSHGLGGSRTGYSYLGKFWASHGYVSVHLTHVGSAHGRRSRQYQKKYADHRHHTDECGGSLQGCQLCHR